MEVMGSSVTCSGPAGAAGAGLRWVPGGQGGVRHSQARQAGMLTVKFAPGRWIR